MLSRPPRARGLKQALTVTSPRLHRVAPPAGAWIETPLQSFNRSQLPSRPPLARGLKHVGSLLQEEFRQVAPSAGAWIETTKLIGISLSLPSASSWRVGRGIGGGRENVAEGVLFLGGSLAFCCRWVMLMALNVKRLTELGVT